MADFIGSSGDDFFGGTPNADTINGLEGNDVLNGGGGDDAIDGGEGDDLLRGNDGDDLLIGGLGNDLLRGGAGVDSFDGGADYPGDSPIIGTFGDRISFYETTATQGVVADLRTGIISNDGFGNVETMTGIEALGADTAFVDTFYGNDDANWLLANLGDHLYGFGGDDSFQISSAPAVVDGGDGHDTLHLSEFGGWLTPDANGDGVAELAPDATGGFFVDLAASYVEDGYGNAGIVTGIESLSGTGLRDVLVGNSGDNVLAGNAGDDHLEGGDGNDTLEGGEGNDFLVGGLGNDTYIVGAGDGIDERAGEGTDEVRTSIDWGLGGTAIENITALGSGNIFLGGNELDNVITGNDGDNYVVAGGGNDVIQGGGGRDIAAFHLPAGTTGTLRIVGGADGVLLVQLVQADGSHEDVFAVTVAADGSATVTGLGSVAGLGTDTVSGIEDLHFFVDNWPEPIPDGQIVFMPLALSLPPLVDGFAHVSGSMAHDVIDLPSLYPDAGTEVTLNATGGHGDDRIIGTAGSNYMRGEEGDDSIDGGDGPGFDVAAFALPAGTTGTLRVVAGTGENVGKLVVERVDGATVEALFLVSFDEAGTATVQGVNSAAFLGTDTVSNVESLDFVVDNPVFDPAQFTHIIVPAGTTAGNDFINGNNESNLIAGGEGDDQLRGNGGDDLIRGGAGNDLMRGGRGTDHFDGGADNGLDSPVLGGFGDRISFFEVAATQGVIADLRTGVIANDGFGNAETMTGVESLGGDTAYADTFHGNDNINLLIGSRGDSLYGYGGDDFFQLSGAAATIAGGDGVDTLYLVNAGFLAPDANGDGIAENVGPASFGWFVDLASNYLEDGYANGGAISGIEVIFGSELGDALLGNGADNTLDGGAGHDLIEGRGGNDVIRGGADDDLLRGGGGDDVIDGGDGFDRASFSSGATGGITVDLTLSGVAQDTGQGMDTLIGVEHVSGTRFDDVIIGDGGDNWLWGGSDGSGVTGNDLISAGAGNDLVEVGTGNHQLDGGEGTDTLSLFGNGTDITSAGVQVDLTLQGMAQDTRQGMMTLTGFENAAGSIHDDLLVGDSGSNVLAGAEGSDRLDGGAGNDTLLGDGSIHPDNHGNGGSGPISRTDDLFAGTSGGGNDLLNGGEGDDVLNGGGGDDQLDGGIGADVLIGGWGADHLSGGDGDDFLIDGVGNDMVEGGEGYDTAGIYFAPGTVGSYSTVAGTGAEAGKLFVVRTFPGGSETVAEIVMAGGSVTVTGLNSASYLGTNTMTGVERLLFSTLPPNPFANPVSPGYKLVELAALEGVVADGYVAGATVFVDANGNGTLDSGEASTITDAQGTFTLTSLMPGPIVAIGGVNIDTGLANEMVLTAPTGSTVINPLTTLVQTLVVQGGGTVDAATAEAQVKAALGIDPAIDLLNLDLLAAAGDGNAAALEAQQAAAIIVAIIAAADDASADGDAEAATLAALAGLVAGGAAVDLTDTAVIEEVLTTALPEVEDLSSVVEQLAAAAEAIDNTTSLDELSDVQSEAMLTGNDLANVLVGGDRDDELSGLGGDDDLSGKGGDDWLDGGTGADRLDGGDGIDTADYSSAPATGWLDVGVVASLADGGYNSDGDLLLNIENLRGSAHRDLLTGNDSANALWGGGGGDLLIGQGGDDSLFGEAGGDLLFGGDGFDDLSGGDGIDVFSFHSTGEISAREGGLWVDRDEILDFEAGTSKGSVDLIDLSGIDADVGKRGDNEFRFIGDKAFSGKAGELHWVDQGVGDDGRRVGLLEGDIDGDRIADFQLVVHFEGIFGASDFIL